MTAFPAEIVVQKDLLPVDVDPSTSKKSHDKSSFGCEDLREWKKNDVEKNQRTLIEEPAMWHLQPILIGEVVVP